MKPPATAEIVLAQGATVLEMVALMFTYIALSERGFRLFRLSESEG